MSPAWRLALIVLGLILAGLVGIIARWQAWGYRMQDRDRADMRGR